MINLFDLSTTMAGTKVLVDKAHQDGYPIRRVVSEIVKKALDPVGGHAESKPVTQESKCVSKFIGTPVKVLIEQEMLKELGMQRKPATIVAKLMGFEACPSEHFDRIPGRIVVESKTYQTGRTAAANGNTHFKKVYHDRIIRSAGSSFSARLDGSRECKDACEIPPRTNCLKNEDRQDSNICGNGSSEKRMALVRQKFAEAKCMAKNEKIQSKEFLDALDVLNSNKEVFLKLIEDPNSLVSKQYFGLQESLSQTKHITVLKPNQQDADVKEEIDLCFTSQESSSFSDSYVIHPKGDNVSHPMRIVVLRPSPATSEDTKTLAASPTQSQRLPKDKHSIKEPEEMGCLLEANENLWKLQRDFDCPNNEMFSVLSNGYNGDESSSNISEDEYTDDEFRSFNESDTSSPASHHSQHNVNRAEGPYSASFLSPPPFSPDSTVISEAKRRLSHRWAKVSSYKPTMERQLIQKCTSTLGEMLFEAKKEEARECVGLAGKKLQVVGQDLQPVSTCLGSGSNDGNSSIESKNRGLPRSHSAPVLSSAYGDAVSNDQAENLAATNQKIKRSKSLFKEKVSSFFSLKNKKSLQEKPSTTELLRNNSYQDASSCTSSEASSYISKDLSGGIPIRNSDQAARILESLSQEKPGALENAIESPGQPSPVSVLESPFADDMNCNSPQPCEHASLHSHRGISRSRPIESIARTLSWDEDNNVGNQFSHHRRHSTGLFEVNAEEQERVVFVQDVLTAAGLDGETDCSVLTKWHLVDSPLSPLLLDRFLGCKGEDAKSRQRRAQQRLLFDFVSVVLMELCLSYTKGRRPSCLPFSHGARGALNPADPRLSSSVTEVVLRRIQELFSGDEKWPCELSCSQVVDGMVRNEVVCGARWLEMGETEVGELGWEFEAQLMEELVGEALDDFISGWSKKLTQMKSLFTPLPGSCPPAAS